MHLFVVFVRFAAAFVPQKSNLKFFFVLVCSAPVYDAMDELTRKFLVEYTSMLREQYSGDRFSMHLEESVSHLGMFYRDTKALLENVKAKQEKSIEGT